MFDGPLARGRTFGEGGLLALADAVIAGGLAAIVAHLTFISVTAIGGGFFPEHPHPSVVRLQALLAAGDWQSVFFSRNFVWVAIPWALLIGVGARPFAMRPPHFWSLVIAVFVFFGFAIVGLGMDCCGDRFSTLNLSFSAFVASGVLFAAMFWVTGELIGELALGSND